MLSVTATPKPYLSFETQPHLEVGIDTERLRLESVKHADFNAYSQLLGNPAVVEKFVDGEPWSVDRTQARIGLWVKRWQGNDPFSSLAVSKNDDDRFIGHVVLGHGDKPGQAELAYVFDNAVWGKGYGKEAVSAVVKDYAPELVRRGYQLDRQPFASIQATSRADNPASVRILTGVGMQAIREEFKFGRSRQVFSIGVEQLMPRFFAEKEKQAGTEQPDLMTV